MALSIAVCGCGHRSRTAWLRHVRALDGLEFVGVCDPSPASLDVAVAEGAARPSECFSDLEAMLAATSPSALIVCCVNEAHASSIAAGLEAGCHVLVEKPFTTALREACRLTTLAEQKGLVLSVVQNWRTKSAGQALRAALRAGTVGDVSHVFFRYLRDREAPGLPEYLFHERDPLLLAMSIHHFDLFRYVLGDEVRLVSARATRPRWSRYEYPSTLQVWMETESGVVISYGATFSSRNGHLPQESLQIEGETGTLHNESQYFEPPLLLSRRGEPSMVDLTYDVPAQERGVAEQYHFADLAVLRDFAESILVGTPPVASARDNLSTMAIIEAVRRATAEQRTVDPQTVLAEQQEGQRA